MNEKVNSHIIQKAFAKNWADENGKIKYAKDGKHGVFSIKAENKDQPITKLGFYSMEIERGMNNIEKDGIEAIRFVMEQMDSSKKVSIKRHTLVAIKFYFLINGLRTEQTRENIEQLTGDFSFNKNVKDSGLSAKEYQEKRMKVVIDTYNKYKVKNDFGEIAKLKGETFAENMKNIESGMSIIEMLNLSRTPEQVEKIQMTEMFNSKFVFIKFNSNNLILTEGGSFQEICRTPECAGRSVYSMNVISPKYAIINILNPYIGREYMPRYKSEFFSDDVLYKQHEVFYVNKKPIFQGGIAFPDIHEDDIYTYTVNEVNDNGAKAAVCNAMMLVHSLKSFVLYNNELDYNLALELIDDLDITRIEDSRR